MEVFDAIRLAFQVSKETKAPCYVIRTVDGSYELGDTSIGPEDLECIIGKTSFDDIIEDDWVFNFFGEIK